MKATLVRLETLGLLVALLTALVAEPAFAGSIRSWDRTKPVRARFKPALGVSNAGLVILDKETNLVWQKDAGALGTATFLVANARCLELAFLAPAGGARGGYRLPRAAELSSLIDVLESDPALPAGHPFVNVANDKYWTADQLVDPPTAVTIDLGDGTARGDGLAASHRVWCVRGPE